jgi:hypothetical protein
MTLLIHKGRTIEISVSCGAVRRASFLPTAARRFVMGTCLASVTPVSDSEFASAWADPALAIKLPLESLKHLPKRLRVCQPVVLTDLDQRRRRQPAVADGEMPG